MTTDSRQQTLDFDKPDREIAQRESMIDGLQLKPSLNQTLRAIYRLAMSEHRSVSSDQTTTTIGLIAHFLSVSERTTRRYTRELERTKLISVYRQPGKPATYRINWAEMFEPQQIGLITQGKLNQSQKSQSEPLTNQSEPLTKREGVGRSVCQGSQQTKSLAADRTCADDSETGTAFASCIKKKTDEVHLAISVPKDTGGWPFRIDQQSLRNLERTQELYEFAVAAGWIRAGTMTRLGFFAAAVQAREHSDDRENPGPLLTWLVKQQAWRSRKHISDFSEDTARQALVRLDHPKPVALVLGVPAEDHPDLKKPDPVPKRLSFLKMENLTNVESSQKRTRYVIARSE